MVGVSEQISSKDSQSLPPATCAANPLPEPIMLLMVIHNGRNGRDVPTLFSIRNHGNHGICQWKTASQFSGTIWLCLKIIRYKTNSKMISSGQFILIPSKSMVSDLDVLFMFCRWFQHVRGYFSKVQRNWRHAAQAGDWNACDR